MIWAIRDPLRYASEVAALGELAASGTGLTIGDMRLSDSGRLTVDLDIEVGEDLRQAVLTYPQSFPAVPPTVCPRSEERWSGHQYGSGGELCLEWGPDNWVPAITGADMVASAVKLLRTEDGIFSAPARVATRHATTIGQEARFERQRLICTAQLQAALSTLDVHADARFSIRFGKPTWRVLVTSMVRDDGEGEWADTSIPLPIIEAGEEVKGRVLVGFSRLPSLAGTATEVRALLLGADQDAPVGDEIILCVAVDGSMSAAYLYNDRNVVFPLMVIAADSSRDRLEAGHGLLVDKRVALIGCGSLGSKMAVSLARSGIRCFLLMDDDVMLPDNIVRNELDWGDVGLHKVDALEAHLRRIVPDAEIVVRRHRLGGQETNGSLDSAVAAVAAADLIIEATANARAFNYAAAAAGSQAPMIWAEVFGGGFGGMVARSRPKLDPAPQEARAIIEGWCRDRDMPVPPSGNDYDGMLGDQPMVADDAAVGLIASITCAMAIDVLLARDPSRFPCSAYMIGMAKKWIFDAPFDTWPIDLGPPGEAAPIANYEDPATFEALQKLAGVIERAKA